MNNLCLNLTTDPLQKLEFTQHSQVLKLEVKKTKKKTLCFCFSSMHLKFIWTGAAHEQEEGRPVFSAKHPFDVHQLMLK